MNFVSIFKRVLLFCFLIAATPAFASATCIDIHSSVLVCNLDENWSQVTPQPHAAAEFHSTKGYFSQIIIDPEGSTGGMNIEFAKDSILSQARATQNSTGFRVHVSGDTSTDSRKSAILVYGLTIIGIDILYANTIVVGARNSVQVVTWRESSNLTQADQDAHLNFLRSVIIGSAF